MFVNASLCPWLFCRSVQTPLTTESANNVKGYEKINLSLEQNVLLLKCVLVLCNFLCCMTLWFKIRDSGNPWLVWSTLRTIVKQEFDAPQEYPTQNPQCYQKAVSHYMNIRPANTFIDFMSCLSILLLFIQKMTPIQSSQHDHPPNSRRPTSYPYPTWQRNRGKIVQIKHNIYCMVKCWFLSDLFISSSLCRWWDVHWQSSLTNVSALAFWTHQQPAKAW